MWEVLQHYWLASFNILWNILLHEHEPFKIAQGQALNPPILYKLTIGQNLNVQWETREQIDLCKHYHRYPGLQSTTKNNYNIAVRIESFQ